MYILFGQSRCSEEGGAMEKKGVMVITKDKMYSMDGHKTKLNNNVLVVGASGSGKTRSIVSPNILMAMGSYIISAP